MAEAEPFHPFIVRGPPPRKHYRSFDDGLSICFTLDIVPGPDKFWHLSLSRTLGELSKAEQELWCRLFFEETPMMEHPSLILGSSARHFFWRAER